MGYGWKRLASLQGHSVCQDHLFGLDLAAYPSALYKAESALDPAEPGWGESHCWQGPRCQFWNFGKGAGPAQPGRASLGNIRAQETTLTTIERWELSEQEYKGKKRWFSSIYGRAPLYRGKTRTASSCLTILEKMSFSADTGTSERQNSKN